MRFILAKRKIGRMSHLLTSKESIALELVYHLLGEDGANRTTA